MVTGVPRSTPRQGAVDFETPIALTPALAALRDCKDGLAALLLLDTIPSHLHTLLVTVAAKRTYIEREVVKAMIKSVGAKRLKSNIPRREFDNLMVRFAN